MKFIELSEVTKKVSIVTIVALFVAHTVFPQLFLAVPIVILFVVMISYPGCEKVGIRGMVEYMQAGYAVTIISVIAILAVNTPK